MVYNCSGVMQLAAEYMRSRQLQKSSAAPVSLLRLFEPPTFR
jgi:hypothetical protein